MDAKRTCSRCRFTQPEWMFRVSRPKTRKDRGGVVCYTRVAHQCKSCEQELRDTKKKSDRFLQKARGTRYRHAKKLAGEFGIEVSEFGRHFDWDIAQIAHDMEHAFKNGCPYCRDPFSAMPGGLQSLTIDIVDPRKPPFYRTNTRLCCETCNKEKQQTPPERWEENLRIRRLRDDWLKDSPIVNAKPETKFGVYVRNASNEERNDCWRRMVKGKRRLRDPCDHIDQMDWGLV